MKLIKVNVLKEWVENWFTMNRFYHPYAKNNNIPITELYDILEQMPSAQPEIIRCENCRRRDDKWEGWEEGKVLYWCDIMDGCVKADDYCSYAERKTDD